MLKRMIGGRYVLERQIGRGGMGLIWEAFDQQLRRRVALKLMTPDHITSASLRGRFAREAMAVARLQNSHVVQIHDYGVDDGSPYFVMELLEGEDLEARIERQRRLPLARVVPLLNHVAAGLAAAHAGGLVHCDLKPGNIFLARGEAEEIAKILDFGIASVLSDGTSDGGPPSGRFLLGTPAYMSPEQLRECDIDHRSDLWSLAVVAYQALTGRLPFDANAIGDLIVKVCTDSFPPPSGLASDLPPEIDALFERALAKDPAQRFQSARDLSASFAALAAGRGAGPLKILVVDDERDMELLLSQCFQPQIERGAYELRFAGDGEEALEELRRRPDVDVILTDLNMPRMDGLTFLERLAPVCPAARAIVVSAYDDMSNIRAAMNRGAFDFLVKPIDFHDLEVTIEKTSRHVAEIRRNARSTEENSALRMLVDGSLAERLQTLGLAGATASQAIEATVVAVEICGAAAVLREARPEAAVRQLNATFEAVVPEILTRGGVIDRFVDHGLVAVFHGPDHPSRAQDACAAARARVEALAARAGKGSPYARGIAVGMAAGAVVLGAVGSRAFGRLGYLALGEVVSAAVGRARAAAPGEILARGGA
jgi:CheY-like chemotaxis protein